jgi:hypothetical protein
MIDPKMISLYQIVHDWWGVAAFAYSLHRILNYLKSFKETSEAALKGVQEVKSDMADGRSSIRTEIKHQTEAVVGALSVSMVELRQMIFTLAQGQAILAPRPARAAKRTSVTTTKQVVVDKQPSL